MSVVVAGSGSGAHDDFPGHGAKSAFGLPIRLGAALRRDQEMLASVTYGRVPRCASGCGVCGMPTWVGIGEGRASTPGLLLARGETTVGGASAHGPSDIAHWKAHI